MMIQCTFVADGDATQQVVIMIGNFHDTQFPTDQPTTKIAQTALTCYLYLHDRQGPSPTAVTRHLMLRVNTSGIAANPPVISGSNVFVQFFNVFYQWRLSTITHKLYWLLLVTPIKILKVNHAERGQRVVYFEIGTGIRQFILDSYAGTCTAIETFTFSDTFPLATYQIRKIVAGACAGNARNDFTATDFKGNRELAIPACITARARYTCRDACRDRWLALAGKMFPVVPGHVQPAILRIWQRAHAGQIIDFI